MALFSRFLLIMFSLLLPAAVNAAVTLSPSSLALTIGQKASISISGATGKISISNSSSSTASASLSGNIINITAKKVGNAIITLKLKNAVLATASVSVAAKSPLSGNTNGRLLASNCFQCHGTYGSGGSIDKLIGMSASKMIDELNEFNTSNTEHANSIMSAHLAGYTPDQLQLIAEYFANP